MLQRSTRPGRWCSPGQARMRSDLAPLAPGDELITELRMLTARRADLVADKTRAVNRLRAAML